MKCEPINHIHCLVEPNSKFLHSRGVYCTTAYSNREEQQNKAMPTDELKFDIQEKPSWRTGGKTTSNLLKDIFIWRDSFGRLSQEDQASFQEAFTVCMNMEYVFHSCLTESVGMTSYEATKEVLERVLGVGGHLGGEKTREEKETVNTAKALMHLRNEHQKMGVTGKLSLEVVCAIHRELMGDLRTDAGNLRTKDAYKRLADNSIQFYPKPDISCARLFYVIQSHNIHMDSYASQSKDWPLQNKFVFLVKCASWLMVQIMEAHPFSEGNGRLAWLLANYVISLANPFPLHLYQFQNFSGTERISHFMDAVTAYRKSPKDGPKDLCALFVEGAWSVWSRCIKAQESRQSSSSSVTVIVQKSKQGEVKSHVKDLGLAKYLGVDESEAVGLVTDIMGRVSVEGFQPHQYTQLKMDGSTDPSIFVRVFP